MKRLILILCLIAAPLTPVWAVQPDEVLSDPALESRARDMSKDLRCLVCRNESIDESNAELARDLRLLVRERLVAGDTNEEALAYIVGRYGEFVLLRPQTGGSNWLLWGAGPLMLLLSLISGGMYLRHRSRTPSAAEVTLSTDEQARLQEILKD